MQRTAVRETYFVANTVLYYTVLSKGTQWMPGGVSFHCIKTSEAPSFLNKDILWEKQQKNWTSVFKEFLVQLLHAQLYGSSFKTLKPNIYMYICKTYESFSCQKLIISTLIHQALKGFERSSCTEQLGSWRSTFCSNIKLQSLSLQGYAISDFK